MTDRLRQPLVFIASDRREAQPWVARWENSRSLPLPVHWARAGTWRGRDVIAIANGVGQARAAAAVEACRSIADGFSGFCSIGTAGALDPSLRIADVVVANAVTDSSQSWPADKPEGPPSRSGLVHTSTRIVRTCIEKTNLWRSGAIIVEMEASAIAKAAKELAVPFYCVRAVSDLANETFFIDFEAFLTPSGGFNVPRLIVTSLRHPVKGFSELFRLQRRTSRAAGRLGEFLAGCNF